MKLEVIFQNLALFFEHLFAAGVLVALRAQQIPRGSSVHRVQRLSVGGYDLIASIFALVSAHADLKL